MTISETELHWAAGFLDGEGTFYITKNGQLRIEARQNYRPSLDKLLRIFGGSLSYHEYKKRRHPPKTEHPGIWTWYIGKNSLAAGVMMTLYPLLSPYRQGQIEKILEKWKMGGRNRCE